MTILTTAQQDALRTVRRVYPDSQIALIGAAALARHIPMTWRNTADLDLVVAISVSDLNSALSSLEGWKRDLARPQRWEAPQRVFIDLVPAPADALEKRQLVWPNGYSMNLGGIRLALAADPVELAEGISIAVPSVPVIALLKMAAYIARPSEREKDLKDLAYILSEYPLSPTDDRFFSDEITSRTLDEPRARGFILGAELRRIVDEQDRELVDQFLERAVSGPGWGRFVAHSPLRNEQRLQEQIDAFRDGFQRTKDNANIQIIRAPSDRLTLVFVVNGEEVKIEATLREPLHDAMKAALTESKNTGRRPDEWELRHENGTPIPDQSAPVSEYRLVDGAILYLTLKVGAGGYAARP